MDRPGDESSRGSSWTLIAENPRLARSALCTSRRIVHMLEPLVVVVVVFAQARLFSMDLIGRQGVLLRARVPGTVWRPSTETYGYPTISLRFYGPTLCYARPVQHPTSSPACVHSPSHGTPQRKLTFPTGKVRTDRMVGSGTVPRGRFAPEPSHAASRRHVKLKRGATWKPCIFLRC